MLNWWRHLSAVTKLAAMLSAIAGAIVSVAAAWPLVEPYAPAHRGFVVEQVGDVRTTTNELLIWKAEDTKNKIRSDSSGWNIQLQKEQDPTTRALIQQRIEQLNTEQEQVDQRIKKLKGQ